MKKLKITFISLILTVSVALGMFATACANRLDTPQNVEVNLDNYTVSWSRVENARGYEVKAVPSGGNDGDAEYFTVSSTKVSCSLQSLEEGDYEVSVRATSGSSKNYSDSKWSDPVSMDKDYYSGCTFSLINNGTEYEVTGWTKPGDTTEIIIPEEYRGKPVVGIAESAFKSKTTLEGVEIEGGNLRYIGKNAFYSCTRLKYITIPDSVTEIGEGAFHSCRILESVTIPSKVTEIADSTFLYCRALADVDLGNVESIGDSAFMGCNENLKEITIPDTVKTIGEKAFAECSVLGKVTVGSGIETISQYAFQNDKQLKTVVFTEDADGKSSLEEIGGYAFTNCTSLEKVTLPYGLETVDSYAFYKDTSLSDINIPASVTKIGAYAFLDTAIYAGQDDSGLVYVGLDSADGKNNKAWVIGFNSSATVFDGSTSIVVGGTVAEYFNPDIFFDGKTVGIADRAFYRATALSAVRIPSYIQYIGDYAFYGCTKVSELIIEGVPAEEWAADEVYIGSYAFASMTIMSNFRFNLTVNKSGVKTIGDHAFYGDTNLTSVEIPSTVDEVGAYAFKNTGIYSKSYTDSNGNDTGNGLDSANGVIYAGGNSGSSSSRWAVGYDSDNYMSTVMLKDGTRGIADYAFTRDTYLQNITGVNSVSYIGEGAFYKCSALEYVEVPESVTEIAPYTFYGCETLRSLGSGMYTVYYNNLVSVGRSAFYGCESFTGLNLTNSKLQYIGKYAFYRCSAMKEINLPVGTGSQPGTLTEIDDYAFYRSGLEKLSIPDSVVRMGQKAFYKNESLASVNFGAGLESIDDYAFYKCTALKEIDIPGNVNTVGDYAFYKCTTAENLVIGDGVETIGKGAFASLPISSLHIPSSVKEIGDYAFKSCTSLNSIIIPSSVEKIGDNAFYGVSNATIYTDAGGIQSQWSSKFNSSYRPVVWGCELSDEGGTHVVSVTISSGSIGNIVRIEGNDEHQYDDIYDEATGEEGEEEKPRGSVNYSRLCSAPEWEGHEFLYWALEDGTPVCDAEDIDLVFEQMGEVVLYAVWAVAVTGAET